MIQTPMIRTPMIRTPRIRILIRMNFEDTNYTSSTIDTLFHAFISTGFKRC